MTNFSSSELVPSAQYWIGNAYYAMRDYKSAIAAQQKVVRLWPENSKAPDALLNIASSQSELGESPAARETLRALVKRYPSSPAAEQAKQRLVQKNNRRRPVSALPAGIPGHSETRSLERIQSGSARLVGGVGRLCARFPLRRRGNKTHFCTMGAVSDVVNMGDWNRMRMWLLAIAVRPWAQAPCSSRGSSICRRRSTPCPGSPGFPTSWAACSSGSA